MLNNTNVSIGIKAWLIEPSFWFTISKPILNVIPTIITVITICSYQIIKIFFHVNATKASNKIMIRILIPINNGDAEFVDKSAIVHRIYPKVRTMNIFLIKEIIFSVMYLLNRFSKYWLLNTNVTLCIV